MSAYASQGSFLFLPPSTSTLESLPIKENHNWNDPPIHKSKSDSTLQNSNNNFNNDNAKNNGNNNNINNKDDNEYWYSKNCLLLSIKSATIDPIRLIQFIGARKGKNMIEEESHNSKTTNRGLRHRLNALSNSLPIPAHSGTNTNIGDHSLSPDCDESWGEYDERPPLSPVRQPRPPYFDSSPSQISSSASSFHRIHTYPKKRSIETHDSDTTTEDDITSHHASVYDRDEGPITPPSPQRIKLMSSKSSTTKNHDDDALQFKIGVNINGRKYTATRALPSFVKLRQDLMQEISSSKMEARHHFHHHIDNDSLIPNLPIGNDRSYSSSEGIFDDLEARARAVVGFAGRGFSRLQAAICSYCPEMEKWLRAVAIIFPASPSLANFLWEPVEGDVRMEDCVLNRRRERSSGGHSLAKRPVRRLSARDHRSLSMANLNSITESDCEESDWDSDENSS